MKTVGLIVEYNPLHYGHVHHYEASKTITGANAVIAIMSGHFLQRGEPAIIGKWARAEAALQMGADLVIELPVRYSCAPAEWFAYGAISLLNATGITDAFCFGSETGTIEPLLTLAKRLKKESPAFQTMLKSELKTGSSYPSAYQAAVNRLLGERANEIASPNNNLGLHYLLALLRTESRIKPYTIPRLKANYHQQEVTDQRIASATAIRKLIMDGNGLQAAAQLLPAATLRILDREFKDGRGPISLDSFSRLLYYQLGTSSLMQLAQYDEVEEGLEYRIIQSLNRMRHEPFTVSRLIDLLKTKRYTRTKLQRMLLRILLRHPKENYVRSVLARGPSCLRVLGFSPKGRMLLKRMKQQAQLPVITSVNREHAALLEEEIQATVVYSAAFRQADAWQMNRDYYQPPIQLDQV